MMTWKKKLKTQGARREKITKSQQYNILDHLLYEKGRCIKALGCSAMAIHIKPFLLCIGRSNVDNNSVLLSPKSNNVK